MYKRQFPIQHFGPEKYADKPGLDLAEQLEASIEEVTQRNCNERNKNNVGDKLVLRTNEWAEVALKFPDGKNLQGQYGPSTMFTLTDDRVLFLPPYPAEKVRALKLNPGERFNLRKAEVNGANGSRPHIEWQVQRVDAPAGEQQDGTLVIQRERAAASIEQGHPEAAARIRAQLEREKVAPAASPEVSGAAKSGVTTPATESGTASVSTANHGTTNHHIASPFQHTGHAALLRDTTNMLIDVLASCKNYSARYAGVVSAEDIRSCLLSAYINISKAGKQ